MATEGKMTLIKYLMFFFNFLFWLSGLALIIIGAVIRDKYGNYLTFADNKYADVAVFLIVVGVVVFIIGFLGCCGAIKENYCMVATFAVLLTIVFILEIAAGALGFAYRKQVKEVVKKSLSRGMDNYSTEKGAKKFFDWLQAKLKCCGYNGEADWKNKTLVAASGGAAGVNATQAPVVKTNGTAAHVPASCKSATGVVYTKGCKDVFENFVQKNLILIGTLGIALAFLQVLGIIFSCCLMREIRGQYEVV